MTRVGSLGAFGLVLLLATAAACGPSAETREAEELLAEIDRMRETKREQRLPLLEALEKKTAQGAVAEHARKSCTEAYRALHDSHVKLDDTRAKLAEVRAKGEPDTELLKRLLEGTRLLQTAQKGIETCQQAVAELRAVGKR
jgi:hypothetical protein